MIRQTGNDAAGVIVVDQEEGEDWRMEEDALVKASDQTERLGCLPSHAA